MAIHWKLHETLKNITHRKENSLYILGVKHLHEYLCDHRFIVINDHKPLKSIFNRSIISCPPGILNFFLCLQKYHFELQYLPNKDMLVSDALSRSHLSSSEPKFTEISLIHHVHFVLLNLPISETSLKQFQLKTKSDPILQTLITYTTHEWPEKHLVSIVLYPYYTHHNDITFCEGSFWKMNGSLSTTLWAEMKSFIHQGHLGIENCKNPAK